jgi:hypothetical protein
MAFQGNCAHCRSFDVMAGLDQYQCLTCGKHTDHRGNAVTPQPTEATLNRLKES